MGNQIGLYAAELSGNSLAGKGESLSNLKNVSSIKKRKRCKHKITRRKGV